MTRHILRVGIGVGQYYFGMSPERYALVTGLVMNTIAYGTLFMTSLYRQLVLLYLILDL